MLSVRLPHVSLNCAVKDKKVPITAETFTDKCPESLRTYPHESGHFETA